MMTYADLDAAVLHLIKAKPRDADAITATLRGEGHQLGDDAVSMSIHRLREQNRVKLRVVAVSADEVMG